MSAISREQINAIVGRTAGQWIVADTVQSDLEGVQYLSHDVWTVYGPARVQVYSKDEGAVIIGNTCTTIKATDEMAYEFEFRGLGSVLNPNKEAGK